jgi:hypothetical protein
MGIGQRKMGNDFIKMEVLSLAARLVVRKARKSSNQFIFELESLSSNLTHTLSFCGSLRIRRV